MAAHSRFVRTCLVTVMGASGLQAAPGPPPPEAFRVMPVQAAGPRITPYLAYQTEMAWQQDDARRASFEAIRSEQDLRGAQDRLRKALLAMIGGLPDTRSPLEPRVTGRLQMRGFRIEKLVFQSLPGVYVTALVYVPDSPGPHPAMLVACGHSANGKVHYQALCQRLVERGYVVICWDPVGQGERSQFWDSAAHRSRYNLICGEHAVLGNLAYLAGANLARWEVWDGMRALDYLLTRQEVDPSRIGITGTSGGGFQAALIAALDPRIAAAAPSCYITALPMRVHNRIFKDPDSDPEQDPYGFLAEGIDHAGLLLLMYPRPVFVAAAVLDFFPIEGTRKTVREMSALYERFGHGDRIAMTEGYHEHAFSDENQQAALGFLDRFMGTDAPGPARIEPMPEAALQCSRTGQVMLEEPHARSLVDDIREYYRARQGTSSATVASLYFGGRYPGIRTWSVAASPGPSSGDRTIAWDRAGASTVGDVQIDKYVVHHSRMLDIPVLHIHRASPARKGTVLWFSERGKVSAEDWSRVSALLDDGHDVVSYDARGLGETRMQYAAVSIDDPSLVGKDPDEAYTSPLSSVLADYVYNSLLTGRPYYLQLIEDAEIVTLFARSQLGARDVAVAAGEGACGLARDISTTLPAIALSPGASTCDASWARIVEDGQERWPIQNLLPGGAYIR